jgi:pseudouridine-5'-phosphate glycosidase
MNFSDEVAAAREDGRPIVALESTIITHGMPYPQNLEVARDVEGIVHKNGAVPATIAVVDGTLHIGLTSHQLDTLGQAKNVAKLSRADMAACIATGGTGATTVAATMIGARLADISVFATGGIGGVHRGVEHSYDISADLHELAQTSVTVVSAGAKAILDLPKTMEVLETLGVPVISFAQDYLPAFWSATSDIVAPLRMDSAAQIAAAHLMRQQMNVPGGQLVANPIPQEAEISQTVLHPIIEQALDEAEAQNIKAKKVTPFLLGRILELTDGASLRANIALVRNNACLAAQIAKEISSRTK